MVAKTKKYGTLALLGVLIIGVLLISGCIGGGPSDEKTPTDSVNNYGINDEGIKKEVPPNTSDEKTSTASVNKKTPTASVNKKTPTDSVNNYGINDEGIKKEVPPINTEPVWPCHYDNQSDKCVGSCQNGTFCKEFKIVTQMKYSYSTNMWGGSYNNNSYGFSNETIQRLCSGCGGVGEIYIELEPDDDPNYKLANISTFGDETFEGINITMNLLGKGGNVTAHIFFTTNDELLIVIPSNALGLSLSQNDVTERICKCIYRMKITTNNVPFAVSGRNTA